MAVAKSIDRVVISWRSFNANVANGQIAQIFQGLFASFADLRNPRLKNPDFATAIARVGGELSIRKELCYY